MRRIVIYSVLILVVQGISFEGTAINPEKCQLAEPNQYNYNVVKPLIKYVRQIKCELEKNELQNRNIENIIKELRGQIDDLEKNNEFQKETIHNLTQSSKITDDVILKLSDRDERLLKCENNFSELNRTNEMLKINEKRISDSYTSSIHSIYVPNYGSFDVLFDKHKTGEKDWIVIQQRVDGKENFFRDWNTYVAGFGSFEGDFFLGLEKIHRLTHSTRYQLLIRMEYFNGTIRYAGYDNFKVDGNETDYTLSSLGEFSGDKGTEFWRGDNLRWHEGLKFSTFDNEHDPWNKECAQIHKGGWWYNRCTASNLNGLYSMHGSKYTQVYWTNYMPLKSVQMMIQKYQPW